MKNKLSFALAGLVLVFSILACPITINNDWGGNGETVSGSGTVIEETRTVSNVSGVELTMQGTLYVTLRSTRSAPVQVCENVSELAKSLADDEAASNSIAPR